MDNAFLVDAPAANAGVWPQVPKKPKASGSAEAATAFQAHLAEAESGRAQAAAPTIPPSESKGQVEPDVGLGTTPLAPSQAVATPSSTALPTATLPTAPLAAASPTVAPPALPLPFLASSAVPVAPIAAPIPATIASPIVAPTAHATEPALPDQSGDRDATESPAENDATPIAEGRLPTGALPTTAPAETTPSVSAKGPRARGNALAEPAANAATAPECDARTVVAAPPTAPSPTATGSAPETANAAAIAKAAATTLRPPAVPDRLRAAETTTEAPSSDSFAGVEGVDAAAAPNALASDGDATPFEKDGSFDPRPSNPGLAKPPAPEVGTYPSGESARFADHLSAAPGASAPAGAFGAQASTLALPPDIEALMRRAEIEIRPGLSRFSLEVDPPEYGRLDIKLVLRRGRLFGEITAEDTNVAKLVERDLGRLRDIFAAQGIGVEELSIRTKLQDGSDSARKDDHSRRGAASVAPAGVEETAASHRSPGARESARSAAERGRLDRLV